MIGVEHYLPSFGHCIVRRTMYRSKKLTVVLGGPPRRINSGHRVGKKLGSTSEISGFSYGWTMAYDLTVSPRSEGQGHWPHLAVLGPRSTPQPDSQCLPHESRVTDRHIHQRPLANLASDESPDANRVTAYRSVVRPWQLAGYDKRSKRVHPLATVLSAGDGFNQMRKGPPHWTCGGR